MTQLPRPLCQGEKETLAVYWSLQASLRDKKETADEVWIHQRIRTMHRIPLNMSPNPCFPWNTALPSIAPITFFKYHVWPHDPFSWNFRGSLWTSVSIQNPLTPSPSIWLLVTHGSSWEGSLLTWSLPVCLSSLGPLSSALILNPQPTQPLGLRGFPPLLCLSKWCHWPVSQADQSSNPLPLKDRSHLLVKIMRIKTHTSRFYHALLTWLPLPSFMHALEGCWKHSMRSLKEKGPEDRFSLSSPLRLAGCWQNLDSPDECFIEMLLPKGQFP